ncbi:MAG: exodeoxyribonuclease III [Steroidobacteraceae bacterium]
MPVTAVTWNVNSLRLRLPQLLEWLTERQVDVLALQETKTRDEDFPREELTRHGWSIAASGQRAYNGVALLSREPARDVLVDIPGFDDPSRRVLAATFARLRVINLYVPNGQSIDSEKYQYKLRWLDALHGWLQREREQHEHLLVMGDFNIAPEDRDVHDPDSWRGSVLVSDAERNALQRLLALGLVDVFRNFDQAAASYSWWDYRAAAFRRNHGLRIDLILASRALAERCQSCQIDKEPRRYERPSDHTPVLATFDI